MIKSIYKITNQINGKCYIGQTNNVQRRFQEHRSMQSDVNGTGKLLYCAMKKYGIENFSFEVIEPNIENYDEREQYWVAYYHAFGEGYNMTPGGSAPPVLSGLNNPNTTHTLEQVALAKSLLKDSDLSSKEIGDITGYDDTAITRINMGIIWRDETTSYPIRKELSRQFNHNRALDIISDLLNTTMTQRAIAEKYGVGRTTVTAINNGQNNRQPELTYPIRNKNNDRHSKTVIMCDKKTHAPIKEFINLEVAAKEMKCSKSAIQACCTGTTKSSCGYYWEYKDK